MQRAYDPRPLRKVPDENDREPPCEPLTTDVGEPDVEELEQVGFECLPMLTDQLEEAADSPTVAPFASCNMARSV